MLDRKKKLNWSEMKKKKKKIFIYGTHLLLDIDNVTQSLLDLQEWIHDTKSIRNGFHTHTYLQRENKYKNVFTNFGIFIKSNKKETVTFLLNFLNYFFPNFILLTNFNYIL